MDGELVLCPKTLDGRTLPYNQTSLPTTTTTSGPPGPTQSGIVANCEEWYVVKANDTCADIAKEYSISQAQFYAWNPAGADCTDLDVEDAYCVKAPTTISTVTTSSTTSAVTSSGTTITLPGPTQAGIPANCNAYALPQADDGYQAFTDRNKITLKNLYNWYPVLNNDCENFWAKEAYCIGVSS